MLGIYGEMVPAILEAIQRLQRDTHKLFDHPTVRVCRFADLELREIAQYGAKAIDCLTTEAQREDLSPWLGLLRDALAAAGALDGTQPAIKKELAAHFSAQPVQYSRTPRRDQRFKDSYNMGVNAEAMLFDPNIAAQPKTLMLYFKRMREIDVPEMMSSILVETKDKPCNITWTCRGSFGTRPGTQ
ncbi:MAG TPA: hypothetical protein VFA99_07655 [Acidobacteriaceae bacterium]|nr:hypothetical protein [Acidobacteriaceae bacterium]